MAAGENLRMRTRVWRLAYVSDKLYDLAFGMSFHAHTQMVIITIISAVYWWWSLGALLYHALDGLIYNCTPSFCSVADSDMKA